MPYRMKSVGFFIFGDCDIYKLEQACIYTGYEKKGIQRGISPWLWVSNRGEQHPCKQPLSAASRAAFPVQSGPY